MFILPEFLLRSIGIAMGYFFNLYIVGLGIYMVIKAIKNQNMSDIIVFLIFTLVMASWTGYLIYSGLKRRKKK